MYNKLPSCTTLYDVRIKNCTHKCSIIKYYATTILHYTITIMVLSLQPIGCRWETVTGVQQKKFICVWFLVDTV